MEEHNKDIEVSKTDEEIKETEKAEAEEPKVDEKPVNEQPQENTEKEPEKETVQKEEEPQPKVKTQVKKSQKKCPAWLKTTGKVIGVMALVGCASFGGTYAAITVLEERMSGLLDDQLNDFYDDFDYSYGNDGIRGGTIFGDGGSSSSKKTNDNSAGLGVYIYNDSDVAQIAAFTDDSLADDAGLQVGDIIISIDGKDTDDYDEVVEKLKDHKPGDTVRVGYERDDVKGEVNVELIDRTSSSSDFPSGNGNRYMQ